MVFKIYNHFSSSAKRSAALKSCYEYTENEYKKVAKHISIRWLSLNQALERLFNNLEEIKLYFIGMNKNYVDNIINHIVYDETKYGTLLSELYLKFAYEFTSTLKNAILLLEKKTTISPMIYDIINGIRIKLDNRIKLQFYGSYEIKNQLKKFPKESINEFVKNIIRVYERALHYLNK